MGKPACLAIGKSKLQDCTILGTTNKTEKHTGKRIKPLMAPFYSSEVGLGLWKGMISSHCVDAAFEC